MNKILILLLSIALSACSIQVSDDTVITTTYGFFKPALPGDPEAKYGSFTTLETADQNK